MRLKFLRSNSTAGLSYAVMIYALAFILYSFAKADEVTYFPTEINFWNEADTKVRPPATPQVPKSEVATKPEKFSWEKHLDPKNPEFFKEGDYTPPEPFMEIVRNPTDVNLRLWFSYIERKNELYTRLEKRMQEFSAPQTVSAPQAILRARLKTLPPIDSDAKRFRFRFYFDSKCPHCKKMMPAIISLAQKGFLVEGVQVDSDRSIRSELPFPIRDAQTTELKDKNVSSVPLLLIGDLQKKVVLRLRGYQSLSDIISSLNQNSNH